MISLTDIESQYNFFNVSAMRLQLDYNSNLTVASLNSRIDSRRLIRVQSCDIYVRYLSGSQVCSLANLAIRTHERRGWFIRKTSADA
jgi:hypothetical protein